MMMLFAMKTQAKNIRQRNTVRVDNSKYERENRLKRRIRDETVEGKLYSDRASDWSLIVP